MPWDRERLLGYVESIHLILAVTDNLISSSAEPYAVGTQKKRLNKMTLLSAQNKY